MEPGYENITNNLVRTNVTQDTPRIQAVDVRRAAYLAVFSGAAGHAYGNGEVYEFWSPPSQGGRGNMPGWAAQVPWKESLKLPASGQLQHLKHLIESRPMLERIPDQSLLAAGTNPPAQPVTMPATRPTAPNRPAESAINRVQATRAADGSYAFVYLPPGRRDVTLALAKLSGSTLNGYWYDPRTGTSQPLAPIVKADTQSFKAPEFSADGDWVLVLDDASRNFGAPGQHPKAR
jgi:hypothetical protein